MVQWLQCLLGYHVPGALMVSYDPRTELEIKRPCVACRRWIDPHPFTRQEVLEAQE